MNWSTGLSWFGGVFKARRPPTPPDTDCADMGTAFGLDASLGPHGADDEPLPAASPTAPAPAWGSRVDRRSRL